MDESGIIRMLELLGSNPHKIKRSGDNIVACCPLGSHPDKHPSFSISINPTGPSRWICFSCGNKGNRTLGILYAVRSGGGGWNDEIHAMIRRQEYGSSTYKISKLQEWDRQKEILNQKKLARKSFRSGYQVRDYEPSFNEDDYKQIMSEVPRYILERGFDLTTCQRFKLGFNKSETPPRLFIPIYSHEGKMVGYSGRLISPFDEQRGYPKYKHAKNFSKEKYLYGESFIDRSIPFCFLTESFMDVINMDQFGMKNCLAIMGSSISTHQVEKIRNWFHKVIILPHDDEAGLKMSESSKNDLEQAGLKVMISPIVPFKRQFQNSYRNPKDPGEWTFEDLQWVLKKIREMAIEQKRAASSEEKEETPTEEKGS